MKLSKDSDATTAAFDQIYETNFKLGSGQGNAKLRETIATELYDQSLSAISFDDVIVANATTGANHVVHQSLLKPGDHVICQYPIYGPCIEEPETIGCDISYLRLDPDNNWQLEMKQLEELIKPGKTKLLMLNNPSNPTGTYFSTELQREIIQLCKKHDIILHSDEIFRPFFHGGIATPTSMLEHTDLDYDKVVVTSSLSKVYGLSGIRIGWIVTRSPELHKTFMSYRVMSISSVSLADELIATEVLGPRCRSSIIAKHLEMAKTNIDMVQQLVDRNANQCEWARPTAGSVGFIKFKDFRSGEAVDDVEFCRDLFKKKNVLLAPASLCFDFGGQGKDFRGRARIAVTTTTQNLQKGLALLEEYLQEQRLNPMEQWMTYNNWEKSPDDLRRSAINNTKPV